MKNEIVSIFGFYVTAQVPEVIPNPVRVTQFVQHCKTIDVIVSFLLHANTSLLASNHTNFDNFELVFVLKFFNLYSIFTVALESFLMNLMDRLMDKNSNLAYNSNDFTVN